MAVVSGWTSRSLRGAHIASESGTENEGERERRRVCASKEYGNTAKSPETCCCHGYTVPVHCNTPKCPSAVVVLCPIFDGVHFFFCTFHLFICAVVVRSMFSHTMRMDCPGLAVNADHKQVILHYQLMFIAKFKWIVSIFLYIYEVFVFFLRFISHLFQVYNCRTVPHFGRFHFSFAFARISWPSAKWRSMDE